MEHAHGDPPVIFAVEETEASSSEGFIRFLMVTANVGSLFEETCQLQEGWLSEMLKRIRKSEAQFLAIHMQEVGGKDYEKCMHQVQEFVLKFQKSCEKLGYCEGYAFLDENFEEINQFTALGSLYLCHESISGKTGVWDFCEQKFSPVNKFEICGGDLGKNAFVDRFRFTQDFFPELIFSRKGYMRIRWHVNDLVIDFINVHLFHDGCNLTAVESPSVYAGYRRKALKFVLRRILEDGSLIESLHRKWKTEKELLHEWMCPVVIFGDFNFRLDNRSFVQRLTVDTEVKKLSLSASSPKIFEEVETVTDSINGLTNLSDGSPLALEFQRKKSKEYWADLHDLGANRLVDIDLVGVAEAEVLRCVLRVQKKGFDYSNHSALPANWRSYRVDDKELEEFPELFECPLRFAPTYPWTENAEGPQGYMKTRAPAWCDRVVMNGSAWQLLNGGGRIHYGSIGEKICMGDHKPVFLCVSMPEEASDILERVKRPLVVAPETTNEKSPLTLSSSSPGKLRNATDLGRAFSDSVGTDYSNSTNEPVLQAVLNLKPVSGGSSNLLFNPETEQQIFTVQMNWRLEPPRRSGEDVSRLELMGSGSNPASGDKDFVTIVTVSGEENTSTVVDASCYGEYSRLATVFEESEGGSSPIYDSFSTPAPLAANALIGSTVELKANREYANLVAVEGEKAEAEIVYANSAPQQHKVELIIAKGREKIVSSSSHSSVETVVIKNSKIAVENANGETETASGRLSRRDQKAKQFTAKEREKVGSNSSDNSVDTAVVKNRRKKTKKLHENAKKCQIRMDANCLARERKTRTDLGMDNAATDWKLKRESISLELWTMKLLNSKNALRRKGRQNSTEVTYPNKSSESEQGRKNEEEKSEEGDGGKRKESCALM